MSSPPAAISSRRPPPMPRFRSSPSPIRWTPSSRSSPRLAAPEASARAGRAGRRLVTILLVLLILYGLVVLAFFLLQTRLLFPGSPGGAHLPMTAERLGIETPDHLTLRGVHLPPLDGGKAGPVILAFGGNGADADGTAVLIHDLYPQADVLAFHYRGYGGNGGRPSSARITADSLAIYELAAPRLPNPRVVGAGVSLRRGGAAVPPNPPAPGGPVPGPPPA